MSLPAHAPGWPGPCPGNTLPLTPTLCRSIPPPSAPRGSQLLLLPSQVRQEADTGGEGSTAPLAPPLPGDDATQVAPCFWVCPRPDPGALSSHSPSLAAPGPAVGYRACPLPTRVPFLPTLPPVSDQDARLLTSPQWPGPRPAGLCAL